jgi:acetoin utilization deacetylase AcuC-like enzyme
MGVILYSHPDCLEHDPGPGHPECPARLEAIAEALSAPAFAALERRKAPRASREQLLRVHSPAHLKRLFAAEPAGGQAFLNADTALSPGSVEAARRAAGAVCAAVDAIMAGEARAAFCAVRPPGHHAERERAMGFCLFNNVAIGALHARAAHHLARVAVVDFDVHHGNGVQAVFERDPALFYGSTHQSPLYPGTGAAGERGVGNIVNAPLAPGSGSAAFRKAFEQKILPALGDFAPQFMFICAGFDGHRADMLAQLLLTEDDFAWATRQLRRLADDLCHGRLVSSLEGGYNLTALARSVSAHVGALMGGENHDG